MAEPSHRYRSANTDAEAFYRKRTGLLFVLPILAAAGIGAIAVSVVLGAAGAMTVFVIIVVAASVYLEWKVGSRRAQKQPKSPTKRRADGVTVVDRDYQG